MINNHFLHTDFAPIVLFAFNRPGHLNQALIALSHNAEFHLSPLFIYCDGPRNKGDYLNIEQTRAIANQWPHPNKMVIEAQINQGLAESVIAGVTQVLNRFGKVIVLEDDLVVDKAFLSFLNRALRKHQDDSRILQISAYMFPIPEFLGRSETLFLPNISSWGWATWSRAWAKFDPSASGWELLLSNKRMRKEFDVGGSYAYSDMLLRQLNGEIDSWAIRWNWSVYCSSGLVLYPPVSLVKNIGFDGSGRHCAALDFDGVNSESKINSFNFSNDVNPSKRDLYFIEAALKRLSGPVHKRILKKLANNFRRLKLKYKLFYKGESGKH
jgi:hypothetical protein